MEEVKQVIVVRHDLQMRKGKIAAQVAHAAMKFLVDNDESPHPDQILVKLSPDEATWIRKQSFTKIVARCDSEDELNDLIMKANLAGIPVYPIIDAGRTEFNGEPTLTCASFGPCEAPALDRITGQLKLL